MYLLVRVAVRVSGTQKKSDEVIYLRRTKRPENHRDNAATLKSIRTDCLESQERIIALQPNIIHLL